MYLNVFRQEIHSVDGELKCSFTTCA